MVGSNGEVSTLKRLYLLNVCLIKNQKDSVRKLKLAITKECYLNGNKMTVDTNENNY